MPPLRVRLKATATEKPKSAAAAAEEESSSASPAMFAGRRVKLRLTQSRPTEKEKGQTPAGKEVESSNDEDYEEDEEVEEEEEEEEFSDDDDDEEESSSSSSGSSFEAEPLPKVDLTRMTARQLARHAAETAKDEPPATIPHSSAAGMDDSSFSGDAEMEQGAEARSSSKTRSSVAEDQLWSLPMDDVGGGRRKRSEPDEELRRERVQQRKETSRLQAMREERAVIDRLLQGSQSETANQAVQATQELARQQARVRRWVLFAQQRVMADDDVDFRKGDNPLEFGDVCRAVTSLGKDGQIDSSVQLLGTKRSPPVGVPDWLSGDGKERPSKLAKVSAKAVEPRPPCFSCGKASVYACSKTRRRVCSLECYRKANEAS